MNSIQLRQERATLVKKARQIYDSAENETRSMTSEEQQDFDRFHDEGEKLNQRALLLERHEKAEAELEESAGRRTSPSKPSEARTYSPTDGYSTPEYRAAYHRYLRFGKEHMPTNELRALEATSDVSGGFMILPTQMASALIKAVDDAVVIRQLATKFPVPNAKSLGMVSLDNDPSAAAWTTELATGDEDSSMSFGNRSLTPHPLAKRIKVSNQLLQQSPDVESLVIERLAYKIAIAQEAAFMTGNGVGKPLGLFTASADGIPTGRDVATGSTSGITGDGLIAAMYTLKDSYRQNAKLLVHRDFIKLLRQLKDGEDRYVWVPNFNGGGTDSVFDIPIISSEYAPSTFTSNLYVGVMGDFSKYAIADALDFSIQRLVELYAVTNQTGFICRAATDGQAILAEAFVRLKCAT